VTEAVLLLIGLALVVALRVWYTSRILKALLEVSSMLVDSHRLIDRVLERELVHRKDLLDRLMARDFDHYKAYELAETATTEPDEVPDEELRRERPWITGPIEPQDTPPDILEELEALERAET
jgi:hypothetical protein